MPRVGDVFQLLSGTLAVPNTTIQSAPYNAQQQDWVLEANNARPITAGGTGATTAAGARTAIGAIGAGDLAAAVTKTPLVGTDSMVIIDSEDLVSTAKNKRWLVSDFRASLATMTNTNFNLVSTDGTNAAGPILTLDRQSPTAATNDLLGIIRWLGRNSAEEVVQYGDMFVQIADHINNQEKSTVVLRHLVNGALTNGLTIDQTGMTVRALMSTGAVSAGTTITAAGDIRGVDLHAVRTPATGGATTGVLFLGNQFSGPGGTGKGAYLLYDGGTYIMPSAPLNVGGAITAGGNVIANGTVFYSPGNTFLQSADLPGGSNVYLRAWSNGTYDAYLRGADGYFIASTLYASSAISTPGSISANGAISAGTNITAGGNIVAGNAIQGFNTVSVRCPNYNPQNIHFWFKGPSDEDRGVIYTTGNSNSGMTLRAANNSGTLALGTNGNIVISGDAGFKVGGGSWSSSSDERIKTVNGDYENGLDQILALQPVRFTYKGNDASPDRPATPTDKEYIGLVAQQAEVLMPELVRQVEGYIDGEAVSDFRVLDNSPLTFAFINGFKAVVDRIDTLHARIKKLEEAA